jgi:hypothetical protein
MLGLSRRFMPSQLIELACIFAPLTPPGILPFAS